RWGSRRWGSRPRRRPDLVRRGVPLGDEPALAPVAVVPPFGLPTVDVLPEVDVPGQLDGRAVRCGTGRRLASVGELLGLPEAAVQTSDQERHLGPSSANPAAGPYCGRRRAGTRGGACARVRMPTNR